MYKSLSFFLSVLLHSNVLIAQDTLRVTLEQADSLFLSNNLPLLAASMRIEEQKAKLIQSRIYPNPVFTADFNAYDPENQRAFHAGTSGQKAMQLEQLILLGGKRKAAIQLASTDVALAEIEFQGLLHQLKFRLHSDLFSTGQLQALLQRYNEQLTLLEALLTSYENQVEKGNLPLKDVVRLKGAYLKLNNDRAELLKEYFQTQSALQTMLHTTSIVVFQYTERDIEKYIQVMSLEELKEIALQNRPELLLMETNTSLAENYLHYQKSMAIPDITLFTSYDQRGGAFNNQINAGLSIALPLWNRNQGNIKAAGFYVEEARYNLKAAQLEALNELQNAFFLYNQTVSEYKKAKSLYNEDVETTLKGITDNFLKRNISIIEFIDFFEAYNEMSTELTRIKIQLVISGEQLNHLSGKELY